MNTWNQISNLNIEDKEKYIQAFSNIVHKIRNRNYDFEPGLKEEKDYFLVHEENQLFGPMVHIVPKQAFELFKEIKSQNPNQLLGFSVLANKTTRVSCFGIPCNLLAKSITKAF